MEMQYYAEFRHWDRYPQSRIPQNVFRFTNVVSALASSVFRIISNFHEIWYTTADLELGDSHMTEYEHFKNSRWRMAILKIVLVITQQPIVQFQWNFA